MDQIRKTLMKSGALLLFLGMLTGIYLAGALTGKIPADGKMVLGSHLNALFGGLILFALAFSLPYVRYSDQGLHRLGLSLIVANYGNWLITGIKALLHVHGIDYTGHASNDIIFGLLNVFVVLPAIGGTYFWFRGFQTPPNAEYSPADQQRESVVPSASPRERKPARAAKKKGRGRSASR